LNETDPLWLEERIHALLAGDLSERERCDLLGLLARDDDAQQTLAEMIDLQNRSRAAFGLQSEPRSLDGLAEQAIHGDRRGSRAAHRIGGTGRLLLPWALSIVACAAAVLCTVAVLTWVRADRAPRPAVARGEGSASMPDLTPVELTQYRALWRSIDEPGDATRPWILLRNGEGEFGDLPGQSAARGGRLLLVRCQVVGQEGGGVARVYLLLPAGQDVRLELPSAGRIDGRDLTCRVSAEQGRGDVELSVDAEGESAAGVSGQASVGGGPVEIGRFRLGGERYFVTVDVVSLTATG